MVEGFFSVTWSHVGWYLHGRVGSLRSAIMPEAKQEKRGERAVATSPLLPLENTWMENTAEKLQARQTAWEGYHRAELISAEELQMLRDAEHAEREDKMEIVTEKGAEYASLYTKLLGKLSRADTIQQVVLLADDLVQAAPDHLDWFLSLGQSDEPLLYQSLLKYVAVLTQTFRCAGRIRLAQGGAAPRRLSHDAAGVA